MISIRSGLMVSGAAIALLAGAPAIAGQTQQPSDDARNAAAGAAANKSGEDIVVTAQKRDQLLIDVPQSVSVIGGDTLAREHATTFEDYLNRVPGLQLDQDTPGRGRLVLRGVNTGGVASTVAVYVDETPFGSSTGLVNGAILAGDFDAFDVSRIEVLRGPQGTLYGASSLGGVLKFVTNAPEADRVVGRVRAGIEATDGGDLSYSGNALINLPLGSNLAVRASGYYRKIGGFIDSIGTKGAQFDEASDVEKNINDAKSYGGRVSALFAPSSTFSLRLSAIVQNIDADAPSTVESDPYSLATLYGPPTLSQFVPSFTDVSYRVYNGTAKIGLGFADLISSTSYSAQKQTRRVDSTYNLSPLIAAMFGVPNELFLAQNTNLKKFTQEVRIASNGSGAIDWLLGGYYDHEDGLIHQQYGAVDPGTLDPAAGLPLLADVALPSKYEEVAGFANITAHLGERVDVDFGGRYSHNRQSATESTDGALAGGTATLPTTRSSEGVFTYSVAPKFKFSRNASLYARVAKGFRPGGPNVLPAGAPADTPRTYKSDSLVSYEVGVKARTADGTFGIDVSVFHLDWNHIQLLGVVNNYGININGTGAKSDGAEVTATLRPTAGLDFSINGAYTNARLSGDTDPIIGGMKGDKLPFTPKLSASVNGDYDWAIGGATKAYIGGSLRFLSKQSGEFDPTFRATYGRQRDVPSYSVIDLRAGLDFGTVALEIYAKNVGNAEGKTSTSAITGNGFDLYPGGAIATGVIRPRTVGLSITASY